MKPSAKPKFSPRSVVYDRWWPWRVGSVIRQLKTVLYVEWSDGEIWKYDRDHIQFLEKVQ